MLRVIICMLIGYLLGSLNPAAFLSWVKKKDLREYGSGNLGATNATLVLGKKYGVIVMLFDVLKSYISIKIAQLLLPKYILVGIFTGCCAIIGHIFPFYLNFNGGKGVAAFAGLLLAIDPNVTFFLIIICLILVIASNYVVAAPITAALSAPFLIGIRMRSIGTFLLLLLIGSLIVSKHQENLIRIKNGTEMKVSEYLKKKSHANG